MSDVSKSVTLTENQRAFVHILAHDPYSNATKAAAEAGYTKGPGLGQTAYKLLHEPRFAHVAAAYAAKLSEVRAERDERLKLSDQTITDAIAGIALATAIDDEGKRPAFRDQLKGLELLAKIRGMLKERGPSDELEAFAAKIFAPS